MQKNFEYDINKHFPVPTKLDIWGWRFLGIGLLAQGYAYVFLQNNATDSFLFWVGIFILFGGLCSLVSVLNNNKPLVNTVSYLKIIDDTIHWKLGPFQSKKEVAFQNIKNIIFTDRDLFIMTTNKVELVLPIHRIHTEKRKEFESIMRSWYQKNIQIKT